MCFLKADDVVAVGLSDNSVALWDSVRSSVIQRVRSPEKTLLYSMRMWGDSIEALQVASGTIYNEILIWKISPQTMCSSSKEHSTPSNSTQGHIPDHGLQFVAIHLSKLTGHEGSIFRISWSSDGTEVVSVSDDRSARMWLVGGQRKNFRDSGKIIVPDISANLILFGHNARIWDCYVSDSIVITAGEDCTCRVWGKDGSELLMVKEHIGRGIWRCLYDPNSSLLITGGFDSAIKVRVLCSSKGEPKEQDMVLNDVKEKNEIFTISAPKVFQQPGLMDSKSEYIRCLRFMRENILYVATNNGYLHRVEIINPADVRWAELVRVSKEAPIICMDLLTSSGFSLDVEDMVAIGDGKGNVTVVKVSDNLSTHEKALSFTWSAEKERQLLGIFWCRALGSGYLFTTGPRGVLKLWKIGNLLLSGVDNAHLDIEVYCVAVFRSCFGARILCLDASIKEEILICGDQRGNVTIFSLSEALIGGNSSKMVEEIPVIHFKGAHGISSITSISISTLNFDHVEIRTTGGDGCICYFKYDKIVQRLEFTGMKKLKELSSIQSIFTDSNSEKFLTQGNYAIGFTSADFIVWDLVNEIKMLQIPCGGWRRSYSYHLGHVPEYQNCFAYLKDHVIHIQRLWVLSNERKPIPQTVHMQFHGREIHSLCFISTILHSDQNESYLWTATGCEDGTVRLTRYSPIDMESCESKLLGEHVGGSAVRSVYFTSKMHTIGVAENCSAVSKFISHSSPNSKDSKFLLISVGAKQVLTSWVLQCEAPENSLMSFQWLSTHMPPKFASSRRKVENILETAEKGNSVNMSSAPLAESDSSECKKTKPLSFLMDQIENDWRYLAVTAFLLKHIDSRITVCFIVVASSDATLTMKALLLPSRLWFDVAVLVPQTSPILALQNLVVPGFTCSQDGGQVRSIYIIISGSTDGSITFWDLTEIVEDFMKLVLEIQPQMLIDCQKRPQTGRGSQGGRWWRTLRKESSEDGFGESPSKTKVDNNININNTDKVAPGSSSTQGSDPFHHMRSRNSHVLGQNSSVQHEVRPLYILNSVHQSGVNCLHVSRMKESLHPESRTAHCLVSGGDDQAVHCLVFDLVLPLMSPDSPMTPNYITKPVQDEMSSHSLGAYSHHNCSYKLRILSQDKTSSAHSSAVKGIWTDGDWAFSTGLDQRVRCWKVGSSGELREYAHLIISVPEPEALDAVFIGRYQIAVAGRGMQMIEFSPS